MSLGDVIRQATEMRAQMKAAGTPNLEQAFEQTIRAVWPFTREWHYLCDVCGDVGLEILSCGGTDGRGTVADCDRRKPHSQHEFAVPCRCRAGERWKQKPKTADDALAIAAKVAKPSRFGR